MPITHAGTAIPRTDLRAAYNEAPDPEVAGYIGLTLMAPMEVPDVAGVFGRKKREDMLRDENTARAHDGSYNRSTWKTAEDNYATNEDGHEEPIDDRQSRIYKSWFDFELTATNRINGILMRRLERTIQATLHNTAADAFTGSTNVLSVTNQWSNRASGTPIADVSFGRNQIRLKSGGLVPDTLQLSWKSAEDISQCDEVLDTYKYTTRPETRFSDEELARILRVRRVVVGGAMRNTKAMGAASPSFSDIWPSSRASLLITATGNDIETPCFGRTFFFNEDGSSGPEPLIEMYREDRVRGSVLRGRHETQVKVLDMACAFLFTNTDA